MDDGELQEGTADDGPKGEDSPRSNRRYTREELAVLTRKIFGDEDEDDDGEFWDADSAPWAASNHPAKDEGASVDHPDQESDTRGQSGESEAKANKESKLDGLFGPTPNLCLSTQSTDGLSPSHQHEDDVQDVEDVLAAAANSAPVDRLEGVDLAIDDTPPTTTTSAPPISPEHPRITLCTSPPPLDDGVGALSTFDDGLIGNLQPGESPEAHAGVKDDLSDPVPVPTTQVDLSEALEPCKPAVVISSEVEPHCNTIRRIIRKRGLPEFSPTRPGIFSAVSFHSSDDAPLGKRKRSREDDGDECERAFGPAPVPQSDHQVQRPR